MPMSRSQVHQSQAVAARDGEPAGTVSPLSLPADGLDQRIIRLLQDDGRAAFGVTGRKLRVSGGTIRNRMARKRHVP